MFSQVTGSKQVLVRAAFSDYATYGDGNFAFAATGNLDAPDFIPQGSVRVHNTLKLNAQLSLAHRDEYAGCKPAGCQHDGPEAVPQTLYLHHE
jgi:hypothetical protein